MPVNFFANRETFHLKTVLFLSTEEDNYLYRITCMAEYKYTVKKVSDFPISRRYVTNLTLPGRE